jgi:hypothetical protein
MADRKETFDSMMTTWLAENPGPEGEEDEEYELLWISAIGSFDAALRRRGLAPSHRFIENYASDMSVTAAEIVFDCVLEPDEQLIRLEYVQSQRDNARLNRWAVLVQEPQSPEAPRLPNPPQLPAAQSPESPRLPNPPQLPAAQEPEEDEDEDDEVKRLDDPMDEWLEANPAPNPFPVGKQRDVVTSVYLEWAMHLHAAFNSLVDQGFRPSLAYVQDAFNHPRVQDGRQALRCRTEHPAARLHQLLRSTEAYTFDA